MSFELVPISFVEEAAKKKKSLKFSSSSTALLRFIGSAPVLFFLLLFQGAGTLQELFHMLALLQVLHRHPNPRIWNFRHDFPFS